VLARAAFGAAALNRLLVDAAEPAVQQRSYGAGLVTEGGRIVWLAGMGGTTKSDGSKITDFSEQTRQAFRNIETALKKRGGTLDPAMTPRRSSARSLSESLKRL
jgi:2-iminobutanoate/2-iminopropanoate deaminase